MAPHDELADLRAAVGPQVFEDPVAFRAAFDDFISEGSASTGEVSLLVGASRPAHCGGSRSGSRSEGTPDMAIAVQRDLVARTG